MNRRHPSFGGAGERWLAGGKAAIGVASVAVIGVLIVTATGRSDDQPTASAVSSTVPVAAPTVARPASTGSVVGGTGAIDAVATSSSVTTTSTAAAESSTSAPPAGAIDASPDVLDVSAVSPTGGPTPSTVRRVAGPAVTTGAPVPQPAAPLTSVASDAPIPPATPVITAAPAPATSPAPAGTTRPSSASPTTAAEVPTSATLAPVTAAPVTAAPPTAAPPTPATPTPRTTVSPAAPPTGVFVHVISSGDNNGSIRQWFRAMGLDGVYEANKSALRVPPLVPGNVLTVRGSVLSIT